MPPRSNTSSKNTGLFAALYVVSAILVVFGAAWTAARDDGKHAISLDVFTPFVQRCVAAGRTASEHLGSALPVVGWGCVVWLTLTLGMYGWRRGRGALREAPFAPLVAFISLAGVESFLVLKRWDAALITAVGGFIGWLIVRTSTGEGERPPSAPLEAPAAPFGWCECLALVVITLGGILLRFYALNRIPDSFEGELAPYMLGATDLHGMALANIGWHGPWAPLGILYYLPMWLCFHLFGVSVVSVRLASALVSAATIPLLYLLVRSVLQGAGAHRAALLAAAAAAIDPLQVGWGRSDMHPHGSTAWISILVCVVVVWAVERRSIVGYLGCTLLMGLSWHQYPSGQFAVLIPVIYGGWLYLHRDKGWKGLGGRGWLCVGLGCAVWLIGWPLEWRLALGEWRYPDRFAMLGPRFSMMVDGAPHSLMERLAFTASQAGQNLVELIHGIFIEAARLHHQDILPDLGSAPRRSAAAGIGVGAVGMLLLGRGRPEWRKAAIVPIWIGVGALSAIFSDAAYPKRASTVFPALIACGSIGLVWWGEYIGKVWGRWCERVFTALVGGAIALGFFLATYTWFSGEHYRYGEPEERAVAAQIRSMLQPKTIIVPVFWNAYLAGKLAFLLVDDLKRGDLAPIVWAPPRYNERFEDVVSHPVERAAGVVSDSMWYRWSTLREEIPAIERAAEWRRVVYIAQVDSLSEEHRESVQRLALAEERCLSPRRTERGSADPRYRFVFLECTLEREASVLKK